MIQFEPVFMGFIESARQACYAIGAVDLQNTQPLLTALIDLLHKANSLKQCSIEADDQELNMPPILSQALKNIPDSLQFYVVFDPLDPTSICGSTLKDAIGDIYEALESGLRVLDSEPQKKLAVLWEWRHGYEFHWGRHLLDVIRFLVLQGDITCNSVEQ